MELSLISDIKWCLVSAVFASLSIVFLAMFQWSIIDTISVFFYMPLCIVLWLFFVVVLIMSILSIRSYKKIGRVSLFPLMVMFAALAIVYFVPFTDLWIKADFALYKNDRERIVKYVYENKLVPNVENNVSLISLGDRYPIVSRGGNEIVVEEHDGLKYVFFFTFRGVLDNYSGFVYVPNCGNPQNYFDLTERDTTQIQLLDGNWYYASHY
jgi:hypothetical protein